LADAADLVDGLVRRFAESRPLRAGSFIVTVYGDAIVPRGGELALASLIRIVEPFGISDTLVRTTVSRLVSEGWLEGERIGRRSFYRLTAGGAERFADATRRIYAGPAPAWDGRLTQIVIPAGAGREGLRRELLWAGFGSLGPGALVHPAPDREALAHALGHAARDLAPLILDSTIEGGRAALATLAREAWPLDAVAARYASFRTLFAPLGQASGALDPARALDLRLLLIHEYRKAVLRDPHLPAAFLPEGWSGFAAQALAARLYRAVAEQAEARLDVIGETRDGALPAGEVELNRRFIG